MGSANTRLCHKCGHCRPESAFRIRHRASGMRHNECNDCHLDYQREYRRLRRRSDVSRYMRRVRLARHNPRKVEALTNALIGRLQGMQNVIDELMEWHRSAVESQDLTAQARFFETVIWLLRCSDEMMERRHSDLGTMNDDEVERQLWSTTRVLLKNNPHFVLQAAQAMGMEFAPSELTSVSQSSFCSTK